MASRIKGDGRAAGYCGSDSQFGAVLGGSGGLTPFEVELTGSPARLAAAAALQIPGSRT